MPGETVKLAWADSNIFKGNKKKVFYRRHFNFEEMWLIPKAVSFLPGQILEGLKSQEISQFWFLCELFTAAQSLYYHFFKNYYYFLHVLIFFMSISSIHKSLYQDLVVLETQKKKHNHNRPGIAMSLSLLWQWIWK